MNAIPNGPPDGPGSNGRPNSPDSPDSPDSPHSQAEPAVPTRADVSVAELQSRLFDLGYYDGAVDGTPRPQTFAALARFQHDQGLPASGQADPRTVATLRESYCF
jgi:peptidoglycan hydrolase-like protein with peptidoglycan-binding domain